MGEVTAIGITGHGGLGHGLPWAPPRARRCLFGPPDPQGTKDLLEVETKALEEESMEKWNFDFANERPLSGGRYVWTPVVSGQEGLDSGQKKEGEEEKEKGQTLITDFMRKRKLSSSSQMTSTSPASKSKRRFST